MKVKGTEKKKKGRMREEREGGEEMKGERKGEERRTIKSDIS